MEPRSAAGGSAEVVFRDGGFAYRVVDDWAKLPAGWAFNGVAGVVTDRHDNEPFPADLRNLRKLVRFS